MVEVENMKLVINCAKLEIFKTPDYTKVAPPLLEKSPVACATSHCQNLLWNLMSVVNFGTFIG